MPCWKSYFGIGAAGAAGAGSVIAAVASAGAAVAASIVGAIGSTLWLIAELKGLSECLRGKGRYAEAERVDDRVKALEQEVERLKDLLDRYRKPAS